MLAINDPVNNYAFEVHQYLDGNSSGQSSTCVSPSIGVERLYRPSPGCAPDRQP
jgi:endoglucanase